MKRKIVKKSNGKYGCKTVLEGSDIVTIVIAGLVLGYIAFQVIRYLIEG